MNDIGEYPLRFAFREAMNNLTDGSINAFCHGYARALLWADAYQVVHTDDCPNESPEPSCRNCGLEQDENAAYAYDSPGKWWEGMGIDFADALHFLLENYGLLDGLSELPADWEQHGHDFLLTRNHHGAGFWDRGYTNDMADTLTENAQAFGEHSVLTDDSPRVMSL